LWQTEEDQFASACQPDQCPNRTRQAELSLHCYTESLGDRPLCRSGTLSPNSSELSLRFASECSGGGRKSQFLYNVHPYLQNVRIEESFCFDTQLHERPRQQSILHPYPIRR